ACACAGDASYEPNGRSATTIARDVARATERVATTSSSTVTGIVVAWPSMLSPIESPASSMATPAASKIRAVGPSYAVSIVSWRPADLASRRWWTRTRRGAAAVCACSAGGWLVILCAPRSFGLQACWDGVPVASHCGFAPPVRDRQTAVTAERHPRHLGPRRVLPTLPLGAVDERHDAVDDLGVAAAREQLGTALAALDVRVDHL